MLCIKRAVIYIFLFRVNYDSVLTMLRMTINKIRFKIIKNLVPPDPQF